MREKNKASLQCYSIAFLCIAGCYAGSCLYEMRWGTLAVGAVTARSEATEPLPAAAVAIAIGLVGWIVLAEAYLGVKGLMQSSGTCRSFAHIGVGKSVAILLGVGLVVQIASVVRGQAGWLTVLSPAASVFILIVYLQAAVACRKA